MSTSIYDTLKLNWRRSGTTMGIYVLENSDARMRQADPSPSYQDLELVNQFLRGEVEAFNQLVSRYEKIIYRVCYRMVGNREDAQDLTQETFLNALKAIRTFKQQSSFKTWIYSIATNNSINFLKKFNKEFEPLEHAILKEGDAVLDELEKKERDRIVRQALSRLPPKQRAVITLRIDQELKYEEIAKIVGTSVGTVKANIFFGLENLRKIIAKNLA